MSNTLPSSQFNEYAKPPRREGEGVVHRFDIAPLAVSGLERTVTKNILHTVRSRWKELESINPNLFIGATVFGSIVKGRFHQNSDVDMRIFVDPNALGADRLSDADINMISGFFILCEEGAPESTVQVNPVVLEINEKIIRGEIESLLHDQDQQTNFIGLASPSLCMLFLSLGSGMDKGGPSLQDMRKHLFDTLEEFGEAGEKVYTWLIGKLSQREEHNRRATIYLPDTIQKARRYWRINP